ncbi:MAG: peroxiredoxin [Ostreibacterium sp.]
MLKIGELVPDFTGQTNQGQWKLSDYRGQKVVIYFYPRDDTPGCTTEGNEFNTHLNDFIKNNTTIVGISHDDLAKHQKFSNKYEFNFPLIADEDKNISTLFEVYQLKKFMGKEFMGIIRSTFLINEQGILQQEWRKVKVKDHVSTVLASTASV